MTAQTFGQTPSSLLEIRDWAIARELDVHAAIYLHNEQVNREVERENRDRDFWITMFGGESSGNTPAMSEDQTILSAAINRGSFVQKKAARGSRVIQSNEGILFPLGER